MRFAIKLCLSIALGFIAFVVLNTTIATSSATSRVEPQQTCSISWNNAAGGEWTIPSNWSPQHTPVETDTVCITGTVNNPVILVGSATVASLTIGDTSSSPVLRLQNPLYTDTTLVVNGNLDNNGSLQIAPPCDPNCRTIRIQVNSGTFKSTGTLEIENTGGLGIISASLLNQGQGQKGLIIRGRLTFEKNTLTNVGNVLVGSSGTLTVNGTDQVFNQNGGTITNSNAFTITGNATFNFNGGNIVEMSRY